MKIVDDFARLFYGRRDAYGTGAGYIRKEPLTTKEWINHLAGRGEGLGIFPLLESGLVWFGAVDLDEPDYYLGFRIAETLPGTNFVERTRSGNVHVWSFFSDPTPAWAVRGVMRSVLEALGKPRTEVFPKQDLLRDAMRFGNFINLPYHGHERPVLTEGPGRLTPPYGELTLADFIQRAEAARQPQAPWVMRARTLGHREPQERLEAATFGDRAYLHGCAAYIYRNRHTNPLREGSRDVVLFNVAKQLLNWRELSESEARTMVDEINEASLPPLPSQEVDRLFRNAATRGYTSTGCDDPLMLDFIDPDCPIGGSSR